MKMNRVLFSVAFGLALTCASVLGSGVASASTDHANVLGAANMVNSGMAIAMSANNSQNSNGNNGMWCAVQLTTYPALTVVSCPTGSDLNTGTSS